MTRRTFIGLMLIIFLSGLIQGLLLPVLSLLLESKGCSATGNTLSASALYLGLLLSTVVIEPFIQRFGYQQGVWTGILLMLVPLILFPCWVSVTFWFILRLILGIGINFLHSTTQIWIQAWGEAERRGTDLSIYGLAFGGGFAIGPLLIPLMQNHPTLPFGIMIAFSLFSLFLASRLPETYRQTMASFRPANQSHWNLLKYAWIALLPCFIYGFVESTLNMTLPIAALRSHFSLSDIRLVLAAFFISSLLTILPIGILSDRFGRLKTLVGVYSVGAFCMIGAALHANQVIPLAGFLGLSGLCIGSLYSQGLALLSERLPPEQLATGNVWALILYSVGSIQGPIMAGTFIHAHHAQQMLWLFPCGLLIALLCTLQGKFRIIIREWFRRLSPFKSAFSILARILML